jgi:predicted GNAT family acetyltransferase
VGLVKSSAEPVAWFWRELGRRVHRRALVDRLETAYSVRAEARRRGHARVGVSDLCREAFAHGAEHVQLAVVDGNEPGRALYESLGFKPFAKLRTILFA